MFNPFRSSPWWAILGLAAFMSSCTINSDVMFKTPNDYTFDTYVDSTSKLFRLQPNDAIDMRLFANDGYKLIDMVSDRASRDLVMINRMTFTYTIEFDGMVKLPLIGRVPLAGMTMRQAEMFLEESYAEYYNRPFVQVQVMNRRVTIFPGATGRAQSVVLENNNTTLLEVIAMAGGLANRGKAKRVKLFRKDPAGEGRKVYEFDLSTIEGLKYADIVMEGEDVVYVQPNAEIARELLSDINPLITLLSTTLLVIGIVNGFSR